MIDTHCHILPDFDDGPSDWTQSMELAEAFVADGISEVIATPHQLGMFDNADASERIRQEVGRFNDQLTEAGIELKVYSGAEIRLDVNVSKLLEEGTLLTLADSQYLLLELPSDLLIDITPFIKDLANKGYIAILAHTERIGYLKTHPPLLADWLSAGAVIQVTSAGLLGNWGSTISTFAWELVLNGHASLLATDAHDTFKRRPQLKQARDAISVKLGTHIADRLTIENPTNIISGTDLVPLFEAQNESLNS